MKSPRCVEDLQALVDRKVQESIHLDYKRSGALTNKISEVSKDVSSFANSDGGVLVYGVVEEGHLPVSIDGGVEHAVMTRERLEQKIRSNVSPIIEGIDIVQIPVDDERSLYCVNVPRSDKAPHQDDQNHPCWC